MPELPDVTIYLEALEKRILRQTLKRVQIGSPFLLRTAAPPITEVEGKRVVDFQRLGKRIGIGFEDELWLVLHLMIAGRLHWKDLSAIKQSDKPQLMRSKNQLALFYFENGQLSLTEAGTQRRGPRPLVKSEEALRALDRGGVEVFSY